ncbi:MAG TPA: TonB-dependent receptor [Opitutaceae bacterium]
MQTKTPARSSGCLYLTCAVLAAPFGFLRAQAPVQSLDPYVLTATRTPLAPGAVGSAVDVITAEDLARRQVSSLAGALGIVPGAPLFASGAPGGITSIFLRGANSNQTLFLVDGIRLNDPNTDYQLFLGGSCVSFCDSLEVSHGPQSTLYGGEAVGGVIALRAERGSGAPSGRIAVEAGSFGTVQGAISAQGEHAGWGYVASLQGGHTDNDRVNNAFDSGNLTLRVDRTVREGLAVGATVRGFRGVYGSPGSRFTNDPDNEERESNWLATAFVEFKPAAGWDSKVTLGGQDRRFVAESPRAGRATSVTVVTNRRGVLDWQTTYSGADKHRVTGGLTAEANHTRNTGFGAINKKQGLLAFFVQDEFTPVDNVFLTAGLRSDDHDTFGRATTGRVTAAWLPVPDRFKLRASYGTAFRAPSFLDLYGESAFYRGNPDLDPEEARGWDAGFDVYFANRRGSLGVTWFDTRFRDLIASSPDFTSVVNIQRARTKGLEVAFQATLPGAIETRLAYTYLEADNLSTDTRLLRRPRNSASADVWHDFGRGFSAGAGISWVADRKDVHASTFANIDGEDYTVVRIYGAYRVNKRLSVKARVENLFDEVYEQVHGYPQPGTGAYTGVEWSF